MLARYFLMPLEILKRAARRFHLALEGRSTTLEGWKSSSLPIKYHRESVPAVVPTSRHHD